MQIGAATVESSMELPQKIKKGTALWPCNSTSGPISEEIKKKTQKTQNTYLDVLICILAFFVIFWAADTLAFSAKWSSVIVFGSV